MKSPRGLVHHPWKHYLQRGWRRFAHVKSDICKTNSGELYLKRSYLDNGERNYVEIRNTSNNILSSNSRRHGWFFTGDLYSSSSWKRFCYLRAISRMFAHSRCSRQHLYMAHRNASFLLSFKPSNCSRLARWLLQQFPFDLDDNLDEEEKKEETRCCHLIWWFHGSQQTIPVKDTSICCQEKSLRFHCNGGRTHALAETKD